MYRTINRKWLVYVDQMSSTSRIRRWWTEEEDSVLRQEAEFQCKSLDRTLALRKILQVTTESF